MKKTRRLARGPRPVLGAGAADPDFAGRRPEAWLRDDAGHRAVSGRRLGPGTLYGAIARLEEREWIEPLPADDRRRPYRLTGAGQQGAARAARQPARDDARRPGEARGCVGPPHNCFGSIRASGSHATARSFSPPSVTTRSIRVEVIDSPWRAIDAWLSPAVRRRSPQTTAKGQVTMHQMLTITCAHAANAPYTTREALRCAAGRFLAWFVASSAMLGIFSLRAGLPVLGTKP